MSFKSGTPSAQWKLFLKVRSSAGEGGGEMHSQKQALYSITEVLGKSASRMQEACILALHFQVLSSTNRTDLKKNNQEY